MRVHSAPRAAMLVAVSALACRAEREDAFEGSGTVEVVEVDVAPSVPGRVQRVWVEEGARVRAGDTLVTLTQPTTRADLDARSTQAEASAATLLELERGARAEEVRRARAELEAAEIEVERTAREAARLDSLAAGMASAQQIDEARSVARGAVARRDAARAALALVLDGTRPERVAAARAQVEGARAGVRATRAIADELVLVSPVDGVVTSRNAEPGEMMSPGQSALTVGELARPWVRVYVTPAVLPLLRVGQRATATLDAFPERAIPGRIVAIDERAEYTPRVALTEDERADLLFGVKVAFSDTSTMLKPGLPVTVRFTEARTAQDRIDSARSR